MNEQDIDRHDGKELEKSTSARNVFREIQVAGSGPTHIGNSHVQHQQITFNFGPHTQSAIHRIFGICLREAPVIEPDAFKGRTTELLKLHEWLAPDESQAWKVASIVGMGGLGKTQLSLAYVRAHGHEHSSVFWLNAQDDITLRQSMSAMSSAIFPNDKADAGVADETNDRIRKVQTWLSESWNYRWLLIFDNYDDPDLPNIRSKTGFDIRRFFPGSMQGSILITTRSPKLMFSQRLMLEKFDDLEQSVAVLSQRAGRNLAGDDGARALAERLDGFPLALATAGTFLGQASMTCKEYLSTYENAWTDLYAPDAEELLEYADRTLSTTWIISLDHVRSQDSDAAELLRFLGYFSYEDIWFELIEAGAHKGPSWVKNVTSSKIRFTRAMSKLSDYSLIEATGATYRLHPCLHDWILEYLDATPDKTLFLAAISCLVKMIPEPLDPDFWSITRRLFNHITRIQHKHFMPLQDHYASKMRVLEAWHSFGDLYTIWSEYDKAEEMFLRSIKLKEKAKGKGHRCVLKTYNSLGILHGKQNRYEEAEQLLLQARAGYEKARGVNHRITLYTVANLGNLYAEQGKLEEAEVLYQRVLSAYETELGPTHPSTLETLDNLGLLYHDLGRLTEAEQMHLRAMSGFESRLGAGHTSTLNTVDNLGLLYTEQGNLEQAEVMHLRAATGYAENLGRSHATTLTAMNNLAHVYREQGRLEEAKDKFEQVVENCKGNDAVVRWKGSGRCLAELLSKSIRLKRKSDRNAAEHELTSLIRLSQKHGEVAPVIFEYLAEALVSFDDDENARTAYSQLKRFKDYTPIGYSAECNGCGQGTTLESGHYSCRICYGVDLCQRCMSAYKAKDLTLRKCSEHDDNFFKFGSMLSDLSTLSPSLQVVGLQEWLESLKETYQPHESFEET